MKMLNAYYESELPSETQKQMAHTQQTAQALAPLYIANLATARIAAFIPSKKQNKKLI